MDALAAALGRSPELFPHSYDVGADSVSFIRLSEDNYRRASFLDARILGRQSFGRTVAWPQLQAAVAASRLEEGCHFIFHIGHTGSTLLSRLLRSEEHTSELQSRFGISYAVFCLKKKKTH